MTNDTVAEEAAGTDVHRTITAGSVIGGVGWNVVASVVPQLLTLVLSVAVGRMLGPSEQGVQSFMIFTATTASVVCALGLPLAAQYAISSALGRTGRPQLRSLVTWTLRISLLPSLVAGGATLVVSRLYEPQRALDWGIVTVYAIVATVHSVSAQALLGMHRYRSASVVGLGVQLAVVPATIALLAAGQGVTTLLLLMALGAVASAILTIGLLYRELGRDRPDEAGSASTAAAERPEVLSRRALLRYAGGAGILVLLDTVVMQRSEFAFLAAFHGQAPQQLAYYAVATAAAQAAAKVPLALVPVVLPSVSTLVAAGLMSRVRSGWIAAQRILFIGSGIASGFLLGVGVPLVTLVWGASYRPAGQVLLIAAVVPVLVGPAAALASATLLGAGLLRRVIAVEAAGAVVTLACDAALIGPFGIDGAAVANSAGQLAMVLILLRTAWITLRLPPPETSSVLKTLAMLVAVALPGLALLSLGANDALCLGGGLAGGALLLAVLLPALKPFAADDLELAAFLVDRLPGPLARWIRSGARAAPAASPSPPTTLEPKTMPKSKTRPTATRRPTTPSRPGATATPTPKQPVTPAPRSPRRRLALVVLIATGIGLAVGLGAGAVIAHERPDSYIATSTFALIPGGQCPVHPTFPCSDPGQVALITPIVAASVESTETDRAVAAALHHPITASVSQTLIPDSPLLFTVQARSTTAKDAYTTAAAFEQKLPRNSSVVTALASNQTALKVVTNATVPTDNQAVSQLLIIAGSTAAGALLAGGSTFAYARRSLAGGSAES